MELKDWVVLVIPIVCNGIILFLFQQLYSIRLKKAEQTSNYRQEVLKQFLASLQDFYRFTRNIRYIDSSRSGREYEFHSLWNPAAEKLEELAVYADTHPITIEGSELGFIEIQKKWGDMADMLYADTMKNNYILSHKAAEKFIEWFSELLDLVKKCMARCEEEILHC